MSNSLHNLSLRSNTSAFWINICFALCPLQLTVLMTASPGCCRWWKRWSGSSWRTRAWTTSTCPSSVCQSSAPLPQRSPWETIALPSRRTGWDMHIDTWRFLISWSKCNKCCLFLQWNKKEIKAHFTLIKSSFNFNLYLSFPLINGHNWMSISWSGLPASLISFKHP